ncbi:MAG: hypothetical protein KJO79_03490 [Verrucomicrobiae bacterium]|nr:hypothetical protein [Verrucomicrobiae bacterium]NNJ86220.1 hypothetical protein [Akkermansiaceae bacterium]
MRSDQIAIIGFVVLLLGACAQPTPPTGPQKPASQRKAPAVTNKPEPAQATPETKPVRSGQVTSIAMGQLFTMSQSGGVLIIDTRPPLFYRLGHIHGATNLPLIKYAKIIQEKRPEIDAAVQAGKILVTYCQNVNCPDAHKLAKKLSLLGYDVSVYGGGWEQWKHAGLQ